MNDALPLESARLRAIEDTFCAHMSRAGFREVRTPFMEATSLFQKAIGEVTDVVEKEMYSFDRGDESLTLRPEGTAGAVRAYLEHKVFNAEPLTRWFYTGPMFRAERPQKGRYRQFSQLGAEVFGDAGPGVDAEIIHLLVEFLRAIGVAPSRVLINSLGGPEARAAYRDALVAFLAPKAAELSEESQRRLHKNPLRILDSKSKQDREAVLGAPSLEAYWTAEDRAHFDTLRRTLDVLGTPYEVDAGLVRGLDYYTRTLFEIKAASDILGAGDTVAGGGRYDGMVQSMGGPSVPAFGFGAGLERLVLASAADAPRTQVEVYFAPMGEAAIAPALRTAFTLRAAGVRAEVDMRGASLKSLLRRAETLGATHAVLIGERELASESWLIKDLAAHEQREVRAAEVVAELLSAVGRGRGAEGPRRA
jgi:histidyl-tRNA synthetase